MSKIQDINITPIAIVDPPLLNAAGLHAPYALRIIVELITDDNITGVSEILGTLDIERALHECKHLIVGQDPFQTNKINDIGGILAKTTSPNAVCFRGTNENWCIFSVP